MRVVPHTARARALQDFVTAVRTCFETFTNLDVDDISWRQATLSTKQSGLGLRSTLQHSAAATLASRSACHDLCNQLDDNYTYDTTNTGHT
eukprot:7786221-Karenia_brevis.AAC.1